MVKKTVLCGLLLTVLVAVPAQATYPGQNGVIAFGRTLDEASERAACSSSTRTAAEDDS
jgi:hypothetical protein